MERNNFNGHSLSLINKKQMAQILYDPNTGRKLNPGESVVDKATGKTVTQGTQWVAAASAQQPQASQQPVQQINYQMTQSELSGGAAGRAAYDARIARERAGNFSGGMAPVDDPINEPTGNEQLDEVKKSIGEFLTTMMANGQVVNPAVEITPTMLQQFLDESTQEIEPYYQNLYNSIKQDISSNIKSMQEAYDLSKQAEQESFKQTLAGAQETMSGDKGLAFSGVRGAKNEQMQAVETGTLNKMAQTAASNAGEVLRAGEEKIGTRRISELGINPEYQGVGTNYNYFTPVNTTGSVERQQKTDIYNRRNEREKAAREGRTLDLYKY